MRLPIYQIDAFTDRPFTGNPAAVMPLEQWLPDDVLQAIAAENNLSETVFFVREGTDFRIRWFTPGCEMDLCGHATLASAFVLFTELKHGSLDLRFQSKSGPLSVTQDGDLLCLDFPARPPQRIDVPSGAAEALHTKIREAWQSRDLMVVLDSERAVRDLNPDGAAISSLDGSAVIATAKGDSVDFVSRFFAPKLGILEDPVTGSAHCTLIPFWAQRLGKSRLHALQVSPRGGEIFCEHIGDRVKIAGRAVKVLEGWMSI